MFLTNEEIIAIAARGRGHLRKYITPRGETDYVEGTLSPIDAAAVADSVRQATLSLRHCKINRPWELVNLSERLDPQQTWIGFEFETGFRTSEEYAQVVNHVFDTYNHTVIDREGCGHYPAEITFPPQDESAYTNGEAHIQKFFSWMAEQNIRQITPDELPASSAHRNDDMRLVGTHCNVSTPAYRNASMYTRDAVSRCVRNSLFAMGEDGAQAVFNRRPYGSGSPRGDQHNNYWIEFKVFKSSSDPEVLAKYVSVSRRLAVVMDWLVANVSSIRNTYSGIWNLKEFLLGETDELEMVDLAARCAAGGYPYDPSYSRFTTVRAATPRPDVEQQLLNIAA